MIKTYNKIIYVFSFLMSVNFCTPIFASFFQIQHGFTETQVTFLFACYSIATFLFEIPTGLIADRIGEKKSLIMGSAFTVISTILFISGNTPLIYFGEIVFGIGSTFYSGAFETLVYQYCKESNGKIDYSKTLSKTYSIQWIALCCSFIGCFSLTKYGNLMFPFIATLGANILLCIASILLPSIGKNINQRENTYLIVKGFFQDINLNKELRTICFLNVIFSMILISGYQILQPYLAQSSVPEAYNGLLYFIAAIFASIGSSSFNKLQSIIKSRKVLLYICIIYISFCFFALSSVTGMLAIFLLVSSYRLIWGVASPMFVYMVNQSVIKDDYRNTVFSVISLLTNLCIAILLFIFGTLNISVKYNYTILGILALIFFITLFILRRKKLYRFKNNTF